MNTPNEEFYTASTSTPKSKRTAIVQRITERRGIVKTFGAMAFALVIGTALPANAATYYVDPATGSMANAGTAVSPWSTLEAVFTANKTFAAGDAILLRSGYHGTPQIKGNNTGVVTIQPDAGATPKLKKLFVKTATQWVISGLDICPENAAPGTYDLGNLVDIAATASNITLQNCTLKKVQSIAGFTVNDWYNRVGDGSAVLTRAPYTKIIGNSVVNIGFGIQVTAEGINSLVSRNTITNFYGDGFRALANFGTFEYNTVKNSYVADSNHDDFFQSWSVGTDGVIGHGTISNITVRGNVFISSTDPNQSLPAPPQGIGCFDGMYENWVIENNVISSQTYHGIALLGAINCRIANNTVVENAASGFTTVKPWVAVFEHKKNANNTSWPVLSSGNLIRNNISSSPASLPSGAGTLDHNLTTTAYSTYFTNHAAFDFSLLATSPAVGAGDATSAPSIDVLQNTRSLPYDVGAYEYQPPVNNACLSYEGFNYAPTTNISAAADSTTDTGWTGTTWTGTSDVITAGLNYAGLATEANALQFADNVASRRTIAPAVISDDYAMVGADDIRRLGKAGTTVWLSFLLRADEADADGTKTGGLNLLGASSGGTVKLSLGDVGTSSFWGIKTGTVTTVASSSSAITTGQPVLLVAKISFVSGTSNDLVSLYVNPSLGSVPPTPSINLTGTDIGAFESVELKGNRKGTGDEIRIGTSWNAVIGQ